jgi:TolA-binding protein
MMDFDPSHLVTGILAAAGGAVTAWFVWRNKNLETDKRQADLDKQIAITKDERETNLVAKWERILRDVEERCERRDKEQITAINEQKQVIEKLESTVETLRNLTAELRVQNTAQAGQIRLLQHVAGIKEVQSPKAETEESSPQGKVPCAPASPTQS